MPDIQVTITEETLNHPIVEEVHDISVVEELFPVTVAEETVLVPVVEEVIPVSGAGDELITVLVLEESFNVTLDEILETILPEDAVPYAVAIDTEGSVVYKGEAQPGSQTNEAVWRIRRISFTDNNQDVLTEWADGSSGFTQIWDNRLALSYS